MSALEIIMGACLVGGTLGSLLGNTEAGITLGLGLGLLFLGILGMLNRGTAPKKS